MLASEALTAVNIVNVVNVVNVGKTLIDWSDSPALCAPFMIDVKMRIYEFAAFTIFTIFTAVTAFPAVTAVTASLVLFSVYRKSQRV